MVGIGDAARNPFPSFLFFFICYWRCDGGEQTVEFVTYIMHDDHNNHVRVYVTQQNLIQNYLCSEVNRSIITWKPTGMGDRESGMADGEYTRMRWALGGTGEWWALGEGWRRGSIWQWKWLQIRFSFGHLKRMKEGGKNNNNNNKNWTNRIDNDDNFFTGATLSQFSLSSPWPVSH